MWDTAFECETYKWLSPLPKEAKIKLGTVELIMPHAKIDRRGNVHRYVPKLKAAVLTENAIAVMPDGKKARYDSQKAKKLCPYQGRWKYWDVSKQKVLFRCERGPFVKWCKYITWLEIGAVSCQSCKADVKFMATRCANAESYGILII